MGVVLALAAAFAYGLADFVAGVLSRRVSAWSVALIAQIAATVTVAVGAAFPVLKGGVTGAALAWGTLSGVGVGFGTGFLYRGLGSGQMNVVAPLSAVGAAVVPVLIGVGLGERPSMLAALGIACALPAIWLVSRSASPNGHDTSWVGGAGVLDGLLAGLGFGVLFVALAQVPNDSGLWPVAVGQAVSIPVVAALAFAARAPLSRDRRALGGAPVGVLGAVAAVLFLLASRVGLLSVTAVLSSLYPAVTVALAAVLLHERIDRIQGIGLALATAAVTLVALG